MPMDTCLKFERGRRVKRTWSSVGMSVATRSRYLFRLIAQLALHDIGIDGDPTRDSLQNLESPSTKGGGGSLFEQMWAPMATPGLGGL